jgi:hypothetical protein
MNRKFTSDRDTTIPSHRDTPDGHIEDMNESDRFSHDLLMDPEVRQGFIRASLKDKTPVEQIRAELRSLHVPCDI